MFRGVALVVCGIVACGGDDGGVDPQSRPDANQGVLAVTSIEPTRVLEGLGCVPDGSGGCDESHGVPIVLEGKNIPPDATVTLAIDGVESVPPVVVSGDGAMVAFEFRTPVLEELEQDQTLAVEIAVSGSTGASGELLVIEGLPELVDATGSLETATDLEPLYSRITLGKPIELTGTRNARLFATSEIVVDAGLSARASGSIPGPGGCPGGNSDAPAACAGTGQPGVLGGGGGGGGHSLAGQSGVGAAPSVGGAGGEAVGDESLLPMLGFGAESVHGAGGGGGGSVTGDGPGGGAGGGGGGIVELTSLGALTVTAGTSVDVSGGAGQPGAGATCSFGEHSGGGGGGSGGAVLIRALSVFVDQGSVGGAISVSGGVGGSATPACNDGGAGADGRLRIDLPTDADLPPLATLGGGTVYRGPVIDPVTPRIVSAASLSFDVVGGPSQSYVVERVGDEAGQMITTDANRRATVTVELQPGLNEICAKVVDLVEDAQSEGRNCRSVAFVEP